MSEKKWTPERLVEFAQQVEESSLYNRDQASSWRRWALASSLSINGGAIIALLNLQDIDERSQFWSILWFVGGVVGSIVFGMASAIVNDHYAAFYKVSGWNIRTRSHLAEGQVATDVDLRRFDTLLKRERRIFWIQYLSLACFLLGLGVAIEGLT